LPKWWPFAEQSPAKKIRATLFVENTISVDILNVTALIVGQSHLHYIQKSSNTKSKHLCYPVCRAAVTSIVKNLSKPQATTTRNDTLVVKAEKANRVLHQGQTACKP